MELESIQNEFNEAVILCKKDMESDENKNRGNHNLKALVVIARTKMLDEIPALVRVDILNIMLDLMKTHDRLNSGISKIDKLHSTLDVVSPLFHDLNNLIHVEECLNAIVRIDAKVRSQDEYFDALVRLVGSFYLSIYRDLIRAQNRELVLDSFYTRLTALFEEN